MDSGAARQLELVRQVRKANLKTWMVGKSFSRNEQSYFSQLLSGKAPFGERAARRIERTYDLPENFFDTGPIAVSEKEQARKEIIDTIVRKLGTMTLCKLNALAVLINE